METRNKELHRVVTTCLIYRPDFTYLITKRAIHKKVMPNKWHIPGGGISIDDYTGTAPNFTMPDQWYGILANSLRREIKEETNLKISNPEFLCDSAFIRTDGIPVLCLSYFAPYASGKIKLDEDTSEFAWITLDKLENYDFIDGIEGEIREVDKILKKRKSHSGLVPI